LICSSNFTFLSPTFIFSSLISGLNLYNFLTLGYS
jgi:hypothetical protein